MRLFQKIERVEENRLGQLKKQVCSVFSNIWLPSHGLEHHVRVWEFSKKQLNAYEINGVEFDELFIEALVVACFFHDVGLSKTSSEKHGEISKEFAEHYLKEFPLHTDTYLEELFEAIVMHDDKTYSNASGRNISPGIYRILTVADDMDAIGALGLLRYFEIYWKRGVEAADLTDAVHTNILRRQKFIEQNISFNSELLEFNRERFERSIYYLETFSVEQIAVFYQLFEQHLFTGVEVLNRDEISEKSLYTFFREVINEEDIQIMI